MSTQRSAHCGREGTLAKTVWSIVVECPGCERPVNYYRSMEAADWRKADMECAHCKTPVSARNRRIGEQAVLASISSECSPTQRDQPPRAAPLHIDLEKVGYPKVEITPERQMYKASALGKSGLTTVASFYSDRNLAVLATLRKYISAVEDAGPTFGERCR